MRRQRAEKIGIREGEIESLSDMHENEDYVQNLVQSMYFDTITFPISIQGFPQTSDRTSMKA